MVEELVVGRVKLQFMETPGHTPEKHLFLLRDTEVLLSHIRFSPAIRLFIGGHWPSDLRPAARAIHLK